MRKRFLINKLNLVFSMAICLFASLTCKASTPAKCDVNPVSKQTDSGKGFVANPSNIFQVYKFGVCKTITNGSSFNLYIPVNSAPEWTSFYTNMYGGGIALACTTPSWSAGGWSTPCAPLSSTTTCGPSSNSGAQTRDTNCYDYDCAAGTATPLPSSACYGSADSWSDDSYSSAGAPLASRSCDVPCTYTWAIGAWGACTGTESRNVTCKNQFGTTVANGVCAGVASGFAGPDANGDGIPDLTQTCSATCPTSSLGWSAGACGANILSASAGSSQVLTNALNSNTGTSTATCQADGTWALSASTCTANCPALALTWDAGACGANIAGASAGTSQVLTNSLNANTGSATATCQSDTTWALSSAACTAPPPAATPTPAPASGTWTFAFTAGGPLPAFAPYATDINNALAGYMSLPFCPPAAFTAGSCSPVGSACQNMTVVGPLWNGTTYNVYGGYVCQ